MARNATQTTCPACGEKVDIVKRGTAKVLGKHDRFPDSIIRTDYAEDGRQVLVEGTNPKPELCRWSGEPMLNVRRAKSTKAR